MQPIFTVQAVLQATKHAIIKSKLVSFFLPFESSTRSAVAALCDCPFLQACHSTTTNGLFQLISIQPLWVALMGVQGGIFYFNQSMYWGVEGTTPWVALITYRGVVVLTIMMSRG